MAIFNMGNSSKSDLNYKTVYQYEKPNHINKNLIWIQTAGGDAGNYNELKIMAPAEKEVIEFSEIGDTALSLNQYKAIQGVMYDSSYVYAYFSMNTADSEYIIEAPKDTDILVGIGSSVDKNLNNTNDIPTVYHIKKGESLTLSRYSNINIVNNQEIYLNYKRNYNNIYFYEKNKYYYENNDEYILDSSANQTKDRVYYIKNKENNYDKIILDEYIKNTYYLATFTSTKTDSFFYKEVDYYERIEDGDGNFQYIKTEDKITFENFNTEKVYYRISNIVRQDSFTPLKDTTGYFKDLTGPLSVKKILGGGGGEEDVIVVYPASNDETRFRFLNNALYSQNTTTTKYFTLKNNHAYKITNITNDAYAFALFDNDITPTQSLAAKKIYEKENLLTNPIIMESDDKDYYFVYSFKKGSKNLPIIEDVTLEEKFSEYFHNKIEKDYQETYISTYEPGDLFKFTLLLKNELGEQIIEEKEVSPLTWIKIEDNEENSFNVLKSGNKTLSIKPCVAIKGFNLKNFKEYYNLIISQEQAYGFLYGGLLFPPVKEINPETKEEENKEVFIEFKQTNKDIKDVKSLIERTIVNLENKDVTSVAPYAFYSYSTLETINFPKCSFVGSSAFYGCNNLTQVYLSNCSSIATDAFAGCTKVQNLALNYYSIPENNTHPLKTASAALKNIYLNNCEIINASAFKENTVLEKIVNEQGTIKTIYKEAFLNCTNLKTFPFNSVTSIDTSVFNGCAFDEILELPNLLTVKNSAFANCKDLKGFIANNCTTLTTPFANCNNIETVELNALTGTFPSNIFPSAKNVLKQIQINSIVSLAQSCFEGYTALQSISLENCTVISATAFKNCNSLSSFSSLPIGENKFMNGLSSLELIPHYGFESCHSLEEFYGPKVSQVCSGAFKFCNSIKTLSLPNCKTWDVATNTNSPLYSCFNLEYLNIGLFAGTFPAQIGNATATNAFTKIKTINLPEVTKLANDCFANCTDLTTINLPKCTTIGSSAFKNCESLRGVSTLSNLTTIPNNAFQGCTNFGTKISVALDGQTSVSSPDQVNYFSGVTTIGNYAFQNCVNLQEIQIPNVTAIGASAFEGAGLVKIELSTAVSIISENVFKNCINLKTISMPGVKTISNSAFNNTGFDNLTIPETVMTISNAFNNCPNLSYVKVEGLNTSTPYVAIAKNAFQNCPELKKVDLPINFSYINASTFFDCVNLSEIVLRRPAVVTLGDKNAFTHTKMGLYYKVNEDDEDDDNPIAEPYRGTVYVPSNLIDAYKNITNWNFGCVFKPIEELEL